MKILVTYFTASFGNTKKIAQEIASSLDADLKEIEPQEIYTKEDLNWMDRNSRSTVEMEDKSCRPALKSKMDLSSYDVIFVGYPVWWYREPSIIDTFLESHDFNGKIVVPFATSGSSSIGSEAIARFKEFAKGAIVKEGRVIRMRESHEDIAKWASLIIK